MMDSSGFADVAPLDALKTLRAELKKYKVGLLRKKSLVVANKIDLLQDKPDQSGKEREHLDELEAFCREENLPFMEISAVKETNLNKFKNQLFALYHQSQT